MLLKRLLSSLLLAGAVAGVCLPLPEGRAQESSSAVQQHFLAAQQDQQQGLLDAAVEQYQAVLHLQPGLPEAYMNLGLIYYAQAKFAESARTLTVARRLRPGMPGAGLWMGIDDVQLHHPAQGVALLREATQQNPADKLAQSWLGTALWDAGQMDAALHQFAKAAAQFSDDPDFLFACGEAYGKAATQQTQQLLEDTSGTALSDLIYGSHYAEERDWIKAEGHLRRAIERDPSSLDARLELARVLVAEASLAASREQLEQALRLAPRSAAALALSGEVLLLMQHRAEGLARIKEAVEIDPGEAMDALGLPEENEMLGEPSSAELLGLCNESIHALEAGSDSSPARRVALEALYALAGEQSAAGQAYQTIAAAPVRGAQPESLLVQGMSAIHRHRYDEAEPLLLRWLAVHPRDRATRYQLIRARRDISLAQVSRLIALAPDSYHVHQLLGQLYVSREEDEKALTEYLAVVSARPDLAGVHFWLGHLYWKHGDADHAIPELTRELELSPGHPEAEAELGTVMVAEEHAAEAIPHLESAIHNKPDLWPAYVQLGRAYAIEKNYARAEQVLKSAMAHDQDASMHYQLAQVLRAEGKTAEATRAFAEVRAIKMETMAASSLEDRATGAAPHEGATP